MPEDAGLAVILALVIFRSAVFVFWSQAHFDSDQAVTGLMAKHLSELRAFPVFWYGQTYMLGVEAWLAAPLMRVGGASVTMLKLPLLAMNGAIAWLLFRHLRRDVELTVGRAVFATLFFALAAPITAAHFLTANGGNVEPLLYVLLIWTLRRRQVWMGVVVGIGFLNREFTIYGLLALLVLDAARGALLNTGALRRYAVAIAAAAAVWGVILLLRGFSSAAGPGTTVADLHRGLAANDAVELFRRVCFDVRAVAGGVRGLFSEHWPDLLGVSSREVAEFGIEGHVSQGIAGGLLLLAAVFAFAVARIGWALWAKGWSPSFDYCAYLILTSALSAAGYLAGRCGDVEFFTMRYELLSVLGAVGLAAWLLRIAQWRPALAAWCVACSFVFAASVVAHVRLLVEYVRHPPVAAKQELIAALDAHHVRYAYADFWTAYYVTFMTRERIVLTPTDIVKIRSYTREVDAHRNEAVLVSRRACPGGEAVTAAFWICKP
jgi:hypothetical protein